jgi:hypothetical protein
LSPAAAAAATAHVGVGEREPAESTGLLCAGFGTGPTWTKTGWEDGSGGTRAAASFAVRGGTVDVTPRRVRTARRSLGVVA